MIGRLSGEVLECTPGEVLLDVGGVGYRLRVSLGTYYAVAGRSDHRAVLHVHTHVREDTLALFGFATVEERLAFERLLAVAGVGPRLALSVLSGIETEELERAVRESDRARLERIPGIGRKTAERILLELRGRGIRGKEPEHGRGAPSNPADPAAGAIPDLREDAFSVLVNLGYAADPAAKAVDAAVREAAEGAELQAVLRLALKRLLR